MLLSLEIIRISYQNSNYHLRASLNRDMIPRCASCYIFALSDILSEVGSHRHQVHAKNTYFSCFFSQTCTQTSASFIESQTHANVARTRRDILRSARGTYITVPAVWVRGRAATRVCSILRISDRCTLFRLFEFSCIFETGDRTLSRARLFL